MDKKQVILASASPRRKELLEQMGLSFRIVPCEKEEIITGVTPKEIVENLSYQKAEDVAQRLQDTGAELQQEGDCGQEAGETMLVIGSDTIVVCDGQIMGKPHSEEEAFAMIQKLQGRTHEVYTGVTIARAGANNIAYDTFSECTSVKVHSMEDEEIRDYLALGESMDKAGAYGIQGGFAVFVEEIQGEYGTVLGLPVAALYQALRRQGVRIRQHENVEHERGEKLRR
ncbi:Maf family protein [Lachnospiraceae bacterium JLR.KK008]